MNYFDPVVIAEWISFLAAIFFLQSYTGRWRFFIPFLFLVICTELAGWYLFSYKHLKFNGLPYNILMLISVSFQSWFLSAYTSVSVKKILLFAQGAFLMFGCINLFFFQGLSNYNTKTDVLGNIILALLCCSILYRIATSDEITLPLIRLDYFWLTTGVLVSSLGSAMHYIVQQSLYEYYLQTGVNVGYYINTSLNIILFACMITAFYCRWKLGTSSLQSSLA